MTTKQKKVKFPFIPRSLVDQSESFKQQRKIQSFKQSKIQRNNQSQKDLQALIKNLEVLETGRKLLTRKQTSRERIYKGSNLEKLSYVEKQAKTNYYQYFKKLNRIVDSNRFNKYDNGAFTEHLKKLKELKLPPKPLGIIHRRGREYDFNLSGLKLGTQYAQALTASLQKVPEVQTLNIRDNGLDDLSVQQMIENLEQKKVQNLDLSNNRIGINTLISLKQILLSNNCELITLKLSRNKLTDKHIKFLIDALESNQCLQELDLSQNCIGEYGFMYLGNYLLNNRSITTLDIN